MAQAVPLDPAGIAVQATPEVGGYNAPNSNPALQLASSLADVSPKVNDFIGQLGSQLKANDEAAAHGAALKSSAAGFRDAVAKGELPGGASPWFVQAFNQDRAQLGSAQAAQALVAQSQSWPEKAFSDGGVAYEARLTKELADIHQQVSAVPGMHPTSAQAGFDAGAGPVIAHAVAQNNAYQLQSIDLQKRQDTTQIMEGNLKAYLTAHPTAKPADILAQMKPDIDKGVSIGFQPSEMRELAFNSIRGTAYAMQDPSILNLTRQPFQGGAPLADIAGPDGKPYGEQLAFDEYRINQQANASAMNETRANGLEIQAGAIKLRKDLVAQYGYNLPTTSPAEMEAFAKAHNVPYEVFAATAKLLNTESEGITGLTANFTKNAEISPEGAKLVLDYKAEAAKHGLTDNLVNRVTRDVALGHMTLTQGDAIIAEGASTQRSNEATGRTIATQERGQAHQAMVDANTQGHQARVQNNEYAMNILIEKGDGAALRNPTIKAQIERVGDAAFSGYLSTHPADYEGAQKVQRAALATIVTRRLSRLQPSSAGGTPKLQEKAN